MNGCLALTIQYLSLLTLNRARPRAQSRSQRQVVGSPAVQYAARAAQSARTKASVKKDLAAASKKDAATFFRFDMDVGRSRGVDHCMFRPREEVDNAQSRAKSH